MKCVWQSAYESEMSFSFEMRYVDEVYGIGRYFMHLWLLNYEVFFQWVKIYNFYKTLYGALLKVAILPMFEYFYCSFYLIVFKIKGNTKHCEFI